MGKSRNRDDRLARTSSDQAARNDYDITTNKHTPRRVGHREFEKLKGRNPEQQATINQIFAGGDIVVVGSAGTGKTFISTVCALDMMLNDNYEFKKLVLIRPNQPLGPTVGMLKGDMMEKIWPWICPFVDAFDHRINRKQLSDMIEIGQIELVLVEHMRGRTFKDSIILVDEIQNMGDFAGECLMGRKGEGSKMIIMGDHDQCDLKPNESSALEYIDAVDRLARITNIRRPYHYIELVKNERSADAAWWCSMTKKLETYLENQ